jgi:hypothetical protein
MVVVLAIKLLSPLGLTASTTARTAVNWPARR